MPRGLCSANREATTHTNSHALQGVYNTEKRLITYNVYEHLLHPQEQHWLHYRYRFARDTAQSRCLRFLSLTLSLAIRYEGIQAWLVISVPVCELHF